MFKTASTLTAVAVAMLVGLTPAHATEMKKDDMMKKDTMMKKKDKMTGTTN